MAWSSSNAIEPGGMPVVEVGYGAFLQLGFTDAFGIEPSIAFLDEFLRDCLNTGTVEWFLYLRHVVISPSCPTSLAGRSRASETNL